MTFKLGPVEISELLAARLNHDFVSPITAITNGMELIKISPEMQSECLELIDSSVVEATAQIRLSRLAFGATVPHELFSEDDLSARLRAFADHEKAALELGSLPKELYRWQSKLLVLALLCMRSSFSKISGISISYNALTWDVEMIGEGRSDVDGNPRAEELWLQMATPVATTVQFPIFFDNLAKWNVTMERQPKGGDRLHLRLGEPA